MGKIQDFKRSKPVERIWLAALLLTPIVLWILPATFFDNDRFVVCPSRRFFDIECLGCGMTRAVMHMHHFQFEDALFYNLGSVVIYPALVVIWFSWVYQSLKRQSLLPKAFVRS